MKNKLSQLKLYLQTNKNNIIQNVQYILFRILNWIVWIAMLSAIILSCVTQDTFGYLAFHIFYTSIPFFLIT